MSERAPQLLLVDDEPFNLEILLEYLEDSGCTALTAADGAAAWALLEAEPQRFDVVILDRMMPGVNGLELLQRIRRHPVLQSVPVILQTAMAAREEIAEGVRAGAHYYLTKPFDGEMLRSVVATAVEDRRRYRQAMEGSELATRTFGLLHEAVFRFRDLAGARDLANLLANAFPEPRRVVIGLSELLVNAVEHGNLGISYADKGRLREADCWQEEVEARLRDPAHAHKEVLVHYRRDAERIRVTIRDQGQGFDWRAYLDMDPARAFDTHGRGIAMARLLSFDSLEYHGCGNEVEVMVRLPGDEAGG